MRKALNENPKVQAGAIVVLLIVGVLMFMRMSSQGGGEAAAPPTDAAATDPAAAGATGAGAVPAPATDGTSTLDPAAAATGAAAPTAMPSVPASATAPSPQALIPGPGLPADVARSYAQGNAIVLLIVKEGATDDELVKDSVNQISRSGVAVFVAPVSEVARYSRITQGAGVNRVPALVVVRPRRESGNVPQATVSYGFRSTASVVQAVDDALYSGPDDRPYHPG